MHSILKPLLQNFMKNLAYIALATTVFLSGCEIIYKDDVRNYAEDIVRECDGEIKSIAIVKSGNGDNIYDALAIAIIDGEKYNIDMQLKTGLENSIIKSDDNPCLEHSIKTGVQEFLDIFK